MERKLSKTLEVFPFKALEYSTFAALSNQFSSRVSGFDSAMMDFKCSEFWEIYKGSKYYRIIT